MARWAHADKDPQSGAAKVEVKVDGSAAKTESPGCSTKNCQINSSPPNLLGVVDELDYPNVTVIAMAFPRAARSVSLFFAGKKKDLTMPLKLLSRYKAAKARLVPFRYGAVAFKGQACLSRFVTHAKDGTVLDDGGTMHCQG